MDAHQTIAKKQTTSYNNRHTFCALEEIMTRSWQISLADHTVGLSIWFTTIECGRAVAGTHANRYFVLQMDKIAEKQHINQSLEY